MLKKLWQSLSGSETDGNSNQAGKSGTNAPLLSESDYEFLFLQLLEGVIHGWQQPRVASFFEVIEDRISQQQWLDWLKNSFGPKLLASPAPDNVLASRMVQLGEMRCGAIGDLAYDLGMQVLTRGQHPVFVDFNTDEVDGDDADIIEFAGADLASDTLPSLIEFSEATQDNNGEIGGQEISIEELYQILLQDPNLARQLSQELGLDVTEPEAIIQALVAQAEQDEPEN
jgi:hypothetical protein